MMTFEVDDNDDNDSVDFAAEAETNDDVSSPEVPRAAASAPAVTLVDDDDDDLIEIRHKPKKQQSQTVSQPTLSLGKRRRGLLSQMDDDNEPPAYKTLEPKDWSQNDVLEFLEQDVLLPLDLRRRHEDPASLSSSAASADAILPTDRCVTHIFRVYLETLNDMAIDGRQLLEVDDTFLKSIGIESIGHRKHILMAIDGLKQRKKPTTTAATTSPEQQKQKEQTETIVIDDDDDGEGANAATSTAASSVADAVSQAPVSVPDSDDENDDEVQCLDDDDDDVVLQPAPKKRKIEKDDIIDLDDEDEEDLVMLPSLSSASSSASSSAGAASSSQTSSSSFTAPVMSRETKTCSICLEDIPFDLRHSLANCNHEYCRECLGTYIKGHIEDRSFPIVCPDPTCKKEVSFTDDLELLLDQEQLDRYTQRSLNAYLERNSAEYSCCMTPGCPNVFFREEGDDVHFSCEMCKKDYCVKCKVKWHENSTCEQYQKWAKENGEGDALFEEFVKGQKFKQCPKCSRWVEKTYGCNHIACKCGNHFCYLCGGQLDTGTNYHCKCGSASLLPNHAILAQMGHLQGQHMPVLRRAPARRAAAAVAAAQPADDPFLQQFQQILRQLQQPIPQAPVRPIPAQQPQLQQPQPPQVLPNVMQPFPQPVMAQPLQAQALMPWMQPQPAPQPWQQQLLPPLPAALVQRFAQPPQPPMPPMPLPQQLVLGQARRPPQPPQVIQPVQQVQQAARQVVAAQRPRHVVPATPAPVVPPVPAAPRPSRTSRRKR